VNSVTISLPNERKDVNVESKYN